MWGMIGLVGRPIVEQAVPEEDALERQNRGRDWTPAEDAWSWDAVEASESLAVFGLLTFAEWAFFGEFAASTYFRASGFLFTGLGLSVLLVGALLLDEESSPYLSAVLAAGGVALVAGLALSVAPLGAPYTSGVLGVAGGATGSVASLVFVGMQLAGLLLAAAGATATYGYWRHEGSAVRTSARLRAAPSRR